MSLPFGKVLSKILVSLGVPTDGTISVSYLKGPMDHVSLLRVQYYVFQGKWVKTSALNSTQLRFVKKETLLLAQGLRPIVCFASLPMLTEELTVAEAVASTTVAIADVSIESIDTEILSEEDEVDSR